MHDVTGQRALEEERRRAMAQREGALRRTVDAIALAVERRDPYTAGHQRRVARLATAIAQELGLGSERVQGIGLAATIMGVGKVSVPTEILNRPRRLSQHEYSLVKRYPKVGFEIVKDIEFPWPVPEMLLQHHEHMDGSGYPNGLSRDEILLESRILAVADVVAAMCSHRPYRPALSRDAALAEVESRSGSWYDPAVVDACTRLLKRLPLAQVIP